MRSNEAGDVWESGTTGPSAAAACRLGSFKSITRTSFVGSASMLCSTFATIDVLC